jgi:hypothetical protein
VLSDGQSFADDGIVGQLLGRHGIHDAPLVFERCPRDRIMSTFDSTKSTLSLISPLSSRVARVSEVDDPLRVGPRVARA